MTLPGTTDWTEKTVADSDDTSIELPSAATPKARPQKKISVKPSDDSQLHLL